MEGCIKTTFCSFNNTVGIEKMMKTAGTILMLLCPVLLIGLEFARYANWKRHKDSGFVPGTQHWCMITMLVGWTSGITGVVLFLIGRFGNH